MLNFRNDYSDGAHPAVLQSLTETNLVKTPGYGTDQFCAQAADTIRTLCRAPEAAVHFLVGGTQVNKTVIGALLRPWEGVIAADSGHICVHETGAVENNGHKILTCPTPDGKVTPEMVESILAAQTSEHMVFPRLVYISNTTEIGTVYSRAELAALRSVCDRRGLLLYCDGARLGSAMTAENADTTFADYAALCHAFTIGGTKNGLLFGEALVFPQPDLCPLFRHAMKQQGAILAKGRLLGVQFQAILQDGLYLSLARRANEMAALLRAGLVRLGIPLAADSPSNQLFPILSQTQAAELEKVCAFEVQAPWDSGRLCLRFVTSWTNTPQEVEDLLAVLARGKAAE